MSEPSPIWRIRLFGSPRVTRVGGVGADGQVIRHFESQRAIALLAFLTIFPNEEHSREILADRLWPDAELTTSRNRLKQTLSSLRRQLEPPGVEAGSVLVATRQTLALNSEVWSSDYQEAREALNRGDRSGAERLLSGELLPGLYDEWLDEIRHWWDAQGLVPSAPAFTPPTSVPNGATKVQKLPHFSTQFFGREPEIESLTKRLSECRVVTVTGFGGSGKTRLTVEVARQAPCDAVFVPLAEVAGVRDLMPAIARHLGLSLAVDAHPMDVVAQAIGADDMLLVLDNAEQLVSRPFAITLKELVERCPRLNLLVSSRIPLGLDGEADFPLYPLDIEPTGPSDEALALTAACRLFIDRARQSRADFQVTPRNADSIRKLLNRLGGVPLAIELCAAWAHVISVPQMIARIEASQDDSVLTSRRKDIPDRQKSLHDAFSTTLSLLDVGQRRLLIQLSALRGGMTERMALALFGDDFDLSRLSDLAQAALIRPIERHGEIEFVMLESVRQFAHSLEGAGEILVSVRDSAAVLFASMCQQSRSNEPNPDFGINCEIDWVRFMDSNWENIRELVRYSNETRCAKLAARMLFYSDWYWIMRSHTFEAVALLRETLDAHQQSPALDEDLELGISCLHAYFSNQDFDYAQINRLLSALLAVSEETQMTEAVAEVHYLLAWSRFRRRDFEALPAEVLNLVTIYLQMGKPWRAAMTERLLASVYIELVEHDLAMAAIDRAEASFRRAGREYYLAVLLYDRSRLLFEMGDFFATELVVKESSKLIEPYNDPGMSARIFNMEGRLAALKNDRPAVLQGFVRSVQILIGLRDFQGAVFPAENLGTFFADQGEFELTIPIWGWANRTWEEATGAPIDADDQAIRESMILRSTEKLGAEATHHLLRQGEGFSHPQFSAWLGSLDNHANYSLP